MSAPARLRVAVVGVGHLGTFHARIYAGMPDVELVGLVDHDLARAAALADELGCPAWRTIDELPAGLDAASVAVPTRFHAEVAVPLLERGVPLLVEKPLAPDLEQADRILDAARRGGATLAVGHVERFQPGVIRVREMGVRPSFIECHRLAPFGLRGTDVGVVHDLMIHDLDLVLELIGDEVESIDAAGGAILTEHEDVASVRLIFRNGARANVTASRASLKPMRRFRLFSSQGYVSLDFQDNHGLVVAKGPEWEAGRAALRSMDPRELAARRDWLTSGVLSVTQLELQGHQRPLQAELASFLASVRAGTEPEVTGQDGRRALELAERISTLIRQGTW